MSRIGREATLGQLTAIPGIDKKINGVAQGMNRAGKAAGSASQASEIVAQFGIIACHRIGLTLVGYRVIGSTWQAKGVSVNDEAGLEHEADVMGAKALRTRNTARLPSRQATTTADAPLQMVKEDEFKANPETFLRNNILTLDFKRGMEARAPKLGKKNQDFLGKFHGYSRHWFQLIPDPGRSTPTKPAYLLTPAIEKYIAAYAEDGWLTEVGRMEGVPVAAGEEQYIQSAYVQYLTKRVGDLDEDIGHTSIAKDEDTEGFNPDFVFTDVMNGCAFTITEGEDEDHFTAWHFQSPGSNKGKASEFRRDRNPLDWFGEEEYDTGTDTHKGLFETTNLLWRKDNAWKVLSQANDIDAYNRDQVLSSTFKSRALNLNTDGTGKLDSLKRIYIRYGENQLYEMDRNYINVRKPKIGLALERNIRSLFERVILHIQTDIAAIRGAASVDALHTQAEERVNQRTAAEATVTETTNTIAQQLEAIYTKENQRWFKDQTELLRLTNAIDLSLKGATGISTIFAQKEVAPGSERRDRIACSLFRPSVDCRNVGQMRYSHRCVVHQDSTPS